MKYWIFCLALLLSCTQKRNEKNQPKNLVLIFENPQVNNRYFFSNGVYINSPKHYELSYINDDLILMGFPLNYEKKRDTITIKSSRPLIEITLSYKAFDKLIYFFKGGDTVLFRYNGRKPVASVLNRKTLPMDANYDLSVHEKIFHNDFPGTIKHEAPQLIFFTSNPIYSDTKKEFERISNEALIQLKRESLNESKFLDSLQKVNLISRDISDLYRHALKIKCQFHTGNSDLSKHMLDSAFHPRSDSFLNYQYYNAYLQKFSMNYFEKRVNWIEESNASYADYRSMFDSINHSGFFSAAEKRVLLFDMLERIINKGDKEDIKLYLSKFKGINKDSAAVLYLTKNNNLDFNTSNELQLKDVNGHVTNFKEVLEKYRGKVVYVDIWASWCGPCLASVPHSKELIKEYQKADIVFLYLSKDDQIKSWKNALESHALEGENFIMTNRNVSNFIKEINLTGIPRYLLFDKQGNLVAKNAPGPQGPEIRKLLNKYL